MRKRRMHAVCGVPAHHQKNPQKKGGGQWFDRDRAVTTTERLAQQTLHKLKASVHSVATEMVKWESQIKSAAEVQDAVKSELKVLRNRKHVVELVSGTSSDAGDRLNVYIKGFAVGPGHKVSSVSARGRLGLAPPCRSYANLVTLAALEAMTEKYQERDDKEAIANATSAMKKPREAIVELVGLSNSAVKDLKNAVTAAKKQIEQADKEEQSQQNREGQDKQRFLVRQWSNHRKTHPSHCKEGL